MSHRFASRHVWLRIAAAGAVVVAAMGHPSLAVEPVRNIVAGAPIQIAEGLVAPIAARPAAVGGINPDSLAGADSKDGVFVRDSQSAVDKLALAQKMERLKEWNKSADLYQEVLEKFRDRVVPSASDKDNKITQYTSIMHPVQEQLAKWPQEGLDVYRSRYETPATTLLESAKPGDLDTLTSVYDRYFVTDAGKVAGSRLIDLYLERGEYRAAATVGDRLLKWHPNLLVERAGVMFRTAIALHLAGDDAAAATRADQLKKEFPAERGVVRGKDVILADAVAQEIHSVVMADVAFGSDSWPMFGGSPDRARISPADGRPGARLFTIPLSKPAWANINPQQQVQLEQQLSRIVPDGGTLGLMPVCDRGELFFQDGVRLYAVNLENGLPLSGWVQTYGGAGQYVLPNSSPGGRTRQLTLSVSEKSVLAIMGQPDHQATALQAQPAGEARLVCLDRQTGKENWVTGLSQLPDETAGQRTLQLSGSPLVVGDNVMVVGRAGKQAQFEDCYVLCFNLADGKYRWSCYIASANSTGAMIGMPMNVTAENTTHLAYANGRVFVQTNLGALACLDAYSGTIVWLDIYPRPVSDINPGVNPFLAQQQAMQVQRKPWAYNPVMVVDGRVFTLPSGGKSLLIYDAETGAAVKELLTEHLVGADAPPGSETLLGVVGDNVFVTGDRTVVGVNWKTYDADHFDNESFAWKQTLPAHIRGRGFITTDSIFVPTADRLYRLDVVNGKTMGVYPASYDKVWDESEGPGNVLVTTDHVVLATANSVDGYTDLSVQRKKLDSEIAQAPNDPEPRLRYAEVLFVAGEPDQALAKLDEAISLLGGLNAMQAGTQRDRVFGDALAFARKSGTDDRPDLRERVAQLYLRAGAAARTPAQQVYYRLQRGKYAEAIHNPATAVKLYQDILSDPQWRTSALTDDASGMPTQADVVAERAIDRQIEHDRSLYAPFEREAAKQLEQARTSRDNPAAQLLAVAQTYPNSTVASSAMLEAADSYEAAGNPRLAIQALRQLYFKDPDSTSAPRTPAIKPRVLESMARNYLTLPNRADVAAARLAQGAQISDDLKLLKPLRLPDGRILQDVTFAKALEEVRRYTAAQASRALPDLRIPVPMLNTVHAAGAPRPKRPKPFMAAGSDDVVADVKSLVSPLRDFSRSDRLVAWSSAGKILIFPAAKTTPLASAVALTDAPLGCAWLRGDLLAWASTQLTLLGGDTSQPLWTLDLHTLPDLEVVQDSGARAELVMPNVVQLVNSPNGLIRRGGAFGGNVLVAQQAIPNAPAAVAKAAANTPEQIVDARPVGDRVLVWTTAGRLISVDLATGKVAWQMRLSDHAFDRLVANDDFTVLRVSDDNIVRLISLDTFTGRIRGGKAFTQAGMVPVNLALSDDGTLVYTLPDRLCLKNLYMPWPDASDRTIAGTPDARPFENASQPDQLVIAEGRILALADSGMQKYVRVHSLETGKPLPLKFVTAQGNQEVDRVLSAGKTWNALLRVVGSHLYIYAPDGLFSYNLDDPALAWTTYAQQDQNQMLNVRDLFVSQQFLVLLVDQAAGDGGGGAAAAGAVPAPPLFTLEAFGRYPGSAQSAAESGRRDYVVDVTATGNITGPWQAVDGAICYVTADQKLHLMRGSQEASTSQPAPAR